MNKTIINMRHQHPEPKLYEHIDPKPYSPSGREILLLIVLVVCMFGIVFLPALLKAF